ncbi:MAG TPA: hypothetical protein VE078_09080 [Thermoanaerobaculia bacterium]|nr:hypothetical protein [Thermoanaerobaculia bacterium]
MIRFERVPEPADFDRRARQPGLTWLAAHSDATRPKDFWSPFKSQLADGFRQLCAYSAMYEPVGSVDHFLSCKNHLARAYEWSNYRFSSAWINSSKQNADDQVLDPHEVEDGWFEILLPSLQLVLTDAVPREWRAQAEHTLRRLHLRDDERIVRQRRAWYQMYEEGKLTLEGLHETAPLLARAIERDRPS